jgi:hypothetical protein
VPPLLTVIGFAKSTVQTHVVLVVVHVVVASGGPGLIRDASSSQLLIVTRQSSGTLKRSVPPCVMVVANVMSALKASVPDTTICDSSIVAAGHVTPDVKLLGLSQDDATAQVPTSDPPHGATFPQLAATPPPPLSPPHPATSAAIQINPAAVPIAVALLVSIRRSSRTLGAPS